jgi:hypothetical protein
MFSFLLGGRVASPFKKLFHIFELYQISTTPPASMETQSRNNTVLHYFPRFKRLPIEIRRIIWGFAVHLCHSQFIQVSFPTLNSSRWTPTPQMLPGNISSSLHIQMYLHFYTPATIPVKQQKSSTPRAGKRNQMDGAGADGTHSPCNVRTPPTVRLAMSLKMWAKACTGDRTAMW